MNESKAHQSNAAGAADELWTGMCHLRCVAHAAVWPVIELAFTNAFTVYKLSGLQCMCKRVLHHDEATEWMLLSKCPSRCPLKFMCELSKGAR